MNSQLLVNIIGFVIGFFYNILLPSNMPINNIPIELMFIYLTFPFNNNNLHIFENNNNNNNKLKNNIINYIYNIILSVAFYTHLIRFILRFKESIMYTQKNKLISLICILLIFITKNSILSTDILSLINGIFLYISYSNNNNNKLLNWKIDIPITLALLVYYIYKKKIKTDKYKLIMFNSNLLYHILEIVDWIIV